MAPLDKTSRCGIPKFRTYTTQRNLRYCRATLKDKNSIRKYFFKIFILEQYVDDKWAGIKDLSSIIFYGISLQLDKFVKP
jgi:hypothetical protein